MDRTGAIPPDVRAEIDRRIAEIERDERVRILYAVESGSRAWGFASTDSDYDVRFVYARPRDSYVSLADEDRRDVIERPIVDEIDLNGWDVRKALRLYWKSNPTFAEWLFSPIRYLESGDFAAGCRRLVSRAYSLARGLHHYRSMARTNLRGYLRGEHVVRKKYFYVLRPLLAARWIECEGSVPPVQFERLLALLPADPRLHTDVASLLAEKRAGAELGLGDAVASIDAFVADELARLATLPEPEPPSADVLEALDALLFATLREAGR